MNNRQYTFGSLTEYPDDHQFNGIDIAKFVCVFLICVIHICPFPVDTFLSKQIYFWLRQGLCRIAVPYYFTTAGFLLFRKMKRNEPDMGRVKGYCFRLLRLLGTWSFLLVLSGSGHLWFIGGLVVAVLILSFLLKKKVPFGVITLICAAAYLIGLLGDSYYGFLEQLKVFWAPRFISGVYETFFNTTRNGIFFGLLFVFMGALFAYKKIVINRKLAVLGLILSLGLMAFELYQLRYHSHPKDFNMAVSLIPVVFFLFYLTSHMALPDSPVYARLRNTGLLIFFLHVLINFLVDMGLKALLESTGADLTPWQFLISVGITTALAFLLEGLSRREKLRWLRYLYS